MDFTKKDFEQMLGDQKAARRKVKKTSSSGGLGAIGGSEDDEVPRARMTHGSKPSSSSPRQVLIGCLFLFLLCGSGIGVFLAAYDYMTAGFPLLDVSDGAKMKEVFQSGEPWFVYCVEPLTRSKPIPPIFIEGARASGWVVQTGILECKGRSLPSSGKSVFERFNFTDKQTPAFVVANGNKPVQVPAASLSSANQLSTFITNTIKPKIATVTGQRELTDKCLNRKVCLILGHKGRLPDPIRKSVEGLMSKFRSIKVVSADTTNRQIVLDDALAAQKHPGHILSLVCVHSNEKKARFESITSPYKEAEIETFLNACLQADKDFIEIQKLPTMKVRTNKPKEQPKQEKKQEKKEENKEPQQEHRETPTEGEEDEEVIVINDEE